MTIIAAEMVGVPVLSGLLVLAVDCCGIGNVLAMCS